MVEQIHPTRYFGLAADSMIPGLLGDSIVEAPLATVESLEALVGASGVLASTLQEHSMATNLFLAASAVHRS